MNKKIEQIEKSYLRDLPKFNIGDTIQMFLKIKEEDKTRTQMFEGVVIRMQGSGAGRTFTVRRISYGEGVERTIPFNSPNINQIKVIKKGKVRRAKLYYLRKKIGKKTKVDEKDAFGPDSPQALSSEAQSSEEDVQPREGGAETGV